jgi:choline dehydrogenase-like flavoprotein
MLEQLEARTEPIVVDASIMPEQISGFPHIATIMMAERVAERLATA